MNNESLKDLYDYLQYLIVNNKIDYAVLEDGIINDLYNRIIAGKATRKDFLLYGICDMACTLKKNNVPIKSTTWGRFIVQHKDYINKEWEGLVEYKD